MGNSVAPESFEEAASCLAAASAEHQAVRIRGGGTKLGWGQATAEPDLELRTGHLDQIVEHNHGDLTAVVEAGVPLKLAQDAFSKQAQRLALDPPLGADGAGAATVGGVIAAGDSGPLRHRYGAPRDLVVGMTVALSDGTIARSGGKVIKNVAGYDIAKLFAGSFGTLGMILSVSVRLHPLPPATATSIGSSSDPETLAAASSALMGASLELEALDVAWRGGRGGLLAQSAGSEATRRAERVARMMRTTGLEQVEIVSDDQALWSRQRAGQRSRGAALVRIAARPSALNQVLRIAQQHGGTLVGRAGAGTSYVELDEESVIPLRERVEDVGRSVLLDGPEPLRERVDVWGPGEESALELMRRIKARFDPARACNPGVFVAGI